MPRPRLSLSGVMAVVGFLAVDLAVAGAVFGDDPVSLIFAVVVALWLEAAIFRLLRRRDLRRPFRTAFVFGAALVFLSFVWAMSQPKVIGLMKIKDPVSGAIAFQTRTKDGCALYYVWEGYLDFVERELERRWPSCVALLRSNPYASEGFLLVAWTLPIVLIATASGLLGFAFARFIDQGPRPPAADPEHEPPSSQISSSLRS